MARPGHTYRSARGKQRPSKVPCKPGDKLYRKTLSEYEWQRRDGAVVTQLWRLGTTGYPRRYFGKCYSYHPPAVMKRLHEILAAERG